MFQTKICGVTTVDDARAMADAGVDAIGLNFYPQSRRFVERDVAQAIAESVRGDVLRIGVFVNASADEIREVFESFALDGVQLHGDESPELIAQLDLPVIKAFRIGEGGLSSVGDYLACCRSLDAMPAMLLLDAHCGNQFGGTGQVAPWQLIADERSHLADLPFALAGGLTSENVAEAIALVRPSAVDTAGGVEIADGRKDARRAAQFVAKAKAALGG